MRYRAQHRRRVWRAVRVNRRRAARRHFDPIGTPDNEDDDEVIIGGGSQEEETPPSPWGPLTQ
jgi:hypothetical protein